MKPTFKTGISFGLILIVTALSGCIGQKMQQRKNTVLRDTEYRQMEDRLVKTEYVLKHAMRQNAELRQLLAQAQSGGASGHDRSSTSAGSNSSGTSGAGLLENISGGMPEMPNDMPQMPSGTSDETDRSFGPTGPDSEQPDGTAPRFEPSPFDTGPSGDSAPTYQPPGGIEGDSSNARSRNPTGWSPTPMTASRLSHELSAAPVGRADHQDDAGRSASGVDVAWSPTVAPSETSTTQAAAYELQAESQPSASLHAVPAQTTTSPTVAPHISPQTAPPRDTPMHRIDRPMGQPLSSPQESDGQASPSIEIPGLSDRQFVPIGVRTDARAVVQASYDESTGRTTRSISGQQPQFEAVSPMMEPPRALPQSGQSPDPASSGGWQVKGSR